MFLLLLILAISGAIGTFIENDYGSMRAKELVYHNFWYFSIFFLASINLIVIILKTKMSLKKARTVFHLSFIVILIGAGITHFYGLDGKMHIREGEKSNIILIGGESVEIQFYVALKDL